MYAIDGPTLIVQPKVSVVHKVLVLVGSQDMHIVSVCLSRGHDEHIGISVCVVGSRLASWCMKYYCIDRQILFIGPTENPQVHEDAWVFCNHLAPYTYTDIGYLTRTSRHISASLKELDM